MTPSQYIYLTFDCMTFQSKISYLKEIGEGKMAEGLGEWYKLYVRECMENERLRRENYILKRKCESYSRKKTMYKTEMKRNSAKLARLHKFFRDNDIFKEL